MFSYSYGSSFPSAFKTIIISNTSTSAPNSTVTADIATSPLISTTVTTDEVAPVHVPTTQANFYQQTKDSLAADHTGRILINLAITSYIMRYKNVFYPVCKMYYRNYMYRQNHISFTRLLISIVLFNHFRDR